jgi:bla regulator protein BlaR1
LTPESLSSIWVGGVRELSDHLWQSTVFVGVVALLGLLLRKYQARLRYWLWMAASAKFLIPFSLLVSLGSHLPGRSHALAPETNAYVAIEEMSQPFLEVTALDGPIAIPVAKPTASHVPNRILLPMLTAVC